jgi:hypothetical protein
MADTPSVVDVHNEMSGSTDGPVIQIGSIGRSARTALAGLPPVPVEFTGREDDLRVLAEVLDGVSPSRPVVVSSVSGMGGVGKTTLVLRAAHDAVARGRFPGGSLFINLMGYSNTALQPSEALAILLAALGEENPDKQQSSEQIYRSRLDACEPMLIVLDNASSSQQVRPLLPGSSKHRAVVTSRHTLTDLGARLIDLDNFTATESVHLVDAVLRTARPHDTRVADDPHAARALTQLCAGLPLALSIAASILASDAGQPISELVTALEDAATRLQELSLDETYGVHPVFTLSYARLTPDEARLFRLFAVAPGQQASQETAAALAGLSQRETRRLLDALRRAHMLEPGSPRGYFKFHDLVRLYAEDRLQFDEDEACRRAARTRLATYYYNSACEAHCRLSDETSTRFESLADAHNWVMLEQENFRSVAAIDADFESGVLYQVFADAITAVRLAEEHRTYLG